ncbi:MAG: Uma2 family endonuclease [Betaproteobacteria bacterium]|nr:Uma2 family endonuclease [Candidatus Dechloromonas phosphorivorans]
MGSAIARPRSHEGRLSLWRGTPRTRHEHVDGQIFAMAGATKTHGTIALNISVALRAQLRGTLAAPGWADMKVNVAIAHSYYYPDVVATCADEDLRLDPPQSLSPPQN